MFQEKLKRGKAMAKQSENFEDHYDIRIPHEIQLLGSHHFFTLPQYISPNTLILCNTAYHIASIKR